MEWVSNCVSIPLGHKQDKFSLRLIDKTTLDSILRVLQQLPTRASCGPIDCNLTQVVRGDIDTDITCPG